MWNEKSFISLLSKPVFNLSNNIYGFNIDKLFYRYSDYCYLIDESSGCYDTRRNRMCIVINANTDETAFSNGKTDTEIIKNTMDDLNFSVKIFKKEKNETHTILIKKLKEGKLPNEYALERVVHC